MLAPGSSVEKAAAQESSSGRKQFILNAACLAMIAFTILACFHESVFGGKPVSRLYQLGQRDTLYGKYLTGKREGYDASVYQYFVPSHVFLQGQIKKGTVPLWNPLAGCGAPFLADVETAVFNPLRLLLLCFNEPIRCWNLLIVFNLVNLALGTALLGFLLGLRRFALIYASLISSFCPFLVFQSELIGSSAGFIPLSMASFVFAARQNKLLSKAFAGLACAVMILSGHPEPSFFGIVFASLLYLLIKVQQESREGKWLYKIKILVFSLLDIAIIGAFAFSFSAFMLLPFLELLANSDCYKLGLAGHSFGVPLNSILLNLIHPAYNNSSPFLGILCLPLVLYAGTKFGKNVFVSTLVLAAAIAIALMSQLGPIAWLMSLKTFSWFVPKYAWPSLLVILALLSGFGFQFIVDDLPKSWKKTSMTLAVLCLFAVLALAAIRLFPGLLDCPRQDEAFEKMQVISKFWTRDLIFLTLFALVAAASRFAGRAQGALIVAAVAVLSVLSLSPVARIASPASGEFNYDLLDPIPLLQKDNDRILSMGRHSFCPSSNFCYGINNIVPVNVYHPKRFQRFLVSCGVSPEGVNQFFDGRLSAFTSLAAVKKIVTTEPLLGSEELLPEPEPIKSKNSINWGENSELTLKGAYLRYDQHNREIRGCLELEVDSDSAGDIALQALLLDAKGNVLWMADAERLVDLLHDAKPVGDNFELRRDLLVPVSGGNDEKLSLALQFFNWKKMSYMPRTDKSKTQYLLLADLKRTASQKGNSEQPSSQFEIESSVLSCIKVPDELAKKKRFALLSESSSKLRVYEDRFACNQAYLASPPYLLAGSEEEALRLRTHLLKDWSLIPVLETDNLQAKAELENCLGPAASFESLASKPGGNIMPGQAQQLNFSRPSVNRMRVELVAPENSLLLITENYYPGWKASIIRGSLKTEAKIYRANYLFQAIMIPSGKSLVELEFCPAGFLAGLYLLAAAVLFLLFLIWKELRASCRKSS